MSKKLLLPLVLVLGMFVIFPSTTNATWMTCDATVRSAFVSTQTGWDQETSWDRAMNSSNALVCAAAQFGGDPTGCYRWYLDPAMPFEIIAQGWAFQYLLERPLDPPETTHPWSLFPVTLTSWNSCESYCSSVENAQYCMGTTYGSCYALRLKPGQSASSIRTKAVTRQGGTFGGGGDNYAFPTSLAMAAEFQTGTCTPRPPTVDLTATPASINRGGTSTLSWSSYNVDQCTGVGFSTGGATSGSVTVTPAATTAYTINCTGGAGPATDTATVTVSGDLNPPTGLTSQCSADGNSVTLSWGQATGATGYYVRMDDPTNNNASCADGWFCSDPPDHKNDNYAGTSITYSIVPNRAYSWWVHSANAQGPGAPVTAGFTCPGSQDIDLVPVGISPTTASRGSARTITATIRNQGAGAAGVSNAYIRVPGTKSPLYLGYPSVASIAGGGTQQVSFQATFPSAGEYPVEVCADWYGAVTETNDANNCATFSVSVAETPVSDSVSCTVSPQTVAAGGTVTYTAHPVGGATNPYTWVPSDGVGSYGSGQTATRTFSAPGNYGMQVSATYASSPGNCPIVAVSGGFCPAGTPDLTITATPSRVRSGEVSTVSWSATGVPGASASCTVSGPGVSWSSAVTGSPQCSASGSAAPTISTQSTYTLACGAYSESVTVNVIPNFQEF